MNNQLEEIQNLIRMAEVARDRAKDQMLFLRRRAELAESLAESARTKLFTHLRERDEFRNSEEAESKAILRAEAELEKLKRKLGEVGTEPFPFLV